MQREGAAHTPSKSLPPLALHLQRIQQREPALQSGLLHRSAKTSWEVFASGSDYVARDEPVTEPSPTQNAVSFSTMAVVTANLVQPNFTKVSGTNSGTAEVDTL